MSENSNQKKPLPTIWRVPDELWKIIEPILQEQDPPKSTGRPRVDQRAALDAIIFRMRSGSSGTDCPKSFPTTPRYTGPSRDGSSLACWISSGRVSSSTARSSVGWTLSGRPRTALWARLVLGDQIGPNPTDRGKNGVKRSLLVEADGGPLAAVIAGANVPDFKLLEATLDAMVVERPEPTEEAPQHLCLDKGYDKQPAWEVVE